MTTTPDTDRQARREQLTVLLDRMRRSVLLPSERDLLSAQVAAEVVDGDQAREQLAEADRVAERTATRHGHHHHALADALDWDRSIEWQKLLAEVAQRTRDLSTARRGEAEAVRARKAAEQQAEAMTAAMESTAADALAHGGCHRKLMAQCQRAEKAERAVNLLADAERNRQAADVKLTAVRQAVALAVLHENPFQPACPQCATNHLAAIEAALGDPQPATEPADPCAHGCRQVADDLTRFGQEMQAEPRGGITSHTYEGDGGPCAADFYGQTCDAARDDHDLIQPADPDLIDLTAPVGPRELEPAGRNHPMWDLRDAIEGPPLQHYEATRLIKAYYDAITSAPPTEPAEPEHTCPDGEPCPTPGHDAPALDGAALWAAIRDHAARDHQFWTNLNRHYDQLYRRGVRL
jgi:hypothetical protein